MPNHDLQHPNTYHIGNLVYEYRGSGVEWRKTAVSITNPDRMMPNHRCILEAVPAIRPVTAGKMVITPLLLGFVKTLNSLFPPVVFCTFFCSDSMRTLSFIKIGLFAPETICY